MTLTDLCRQMRSSGKETPLAIYGTKVPWHSEAYLHRINKPAAPEVLSDVSRDLEFPPSLAAHFEQCNGGALFCASAACIGIYLFGCLPKNRSFSRRPSEDSPPIDIRTSNLERREYVVFASYGFDTSFVLVNRHDQTVRCCEGRDTGKFRAEWGTIEEWLSSEIDRLSQLFTPEGQCLVKCEDLLPPGKQIV